MFKKITFTVTAMLLVLGSSLIAAPANALDCLPCPEGSHPSGNDYECVCVDDEPDAGTIDEPTAPSTNDGETVHPETEGSTGSNDEEEEAGEPATWPMYLSLGALAGTLILIFIINLTLGRKKQK